MSKIPYVVIGTAIGVILLLAADMVLNRGNIVAQSVHHELPACSSGCHG